MDSAGRIERVEMSLKLGLHMIVTVILSICHRLIGDTSPMCRSRSSAVMIIMETRLNSLLFMRSLSTSDCYDIILQRVLTQGPGPGMPVLFIEVCLKLDVT